MISARGPDSASADEPGIDISAPLLGVARQTPRPLHPVSASFGGGEQPRRRPASNPFPSGLLPSGLGMAKPTIPQARDRAEVLCSDRGRDFNVAAADNCSATNRPHLQRANIRSRHFDARTSWSDLRSAHESFHRLGCAKSSRRASAIRSPEVSVSKARTNLPPGSMR